MPGLARPEGVQSLPNLKAEWPLPILEPVPTSLGATPGRTQVALPGRVGTANGARRPTSKQEALPCLGAKELPVGKNSWWMGSIPLRAGPSKKLPSLPQPSPEDAKKSHGAERQGAWSWKTEGDGHGEKSLSRAHTMTESVASVEDEEERNPYELLRSSVHCRRTITMTERKRNHNAALARDKAYVQKLLKEGREKPEHRAAREKALDGHWLQAAFAPVTEPCSYLPPSLAGSLPLTRQQVKQVTDVSSITRRSSAVAHDMAEITLELYEIQEAFRVCSLFCALTPTAGAAEAPVMSRQTFCHLACAAEGFASYDGSAPRLCRAVRLFDSLAEEVLVKGSLSASGIVLLDCRSPAVENTPMARLFAKLAQELVKDFDKGLEYDAVAQRGRAEFQARDRVFNRLLPQAAKYAAQRLRHVNEQTKRIKELLEKTEAKPKDLKEREVVPEPSPLRLQVRMLQSPKTRSSPRSRGASPRGPPNKDVPQSPESAKMSQETQEAKDLHFHTLLQMKGESLLGHLVEPEVLRFMAQSHEVFKALFEAYADVPLANGSGHMSLSALVRFGADFGLFPHKVDFQTVQWLYNKECQAHGNAAVSPRVTSTNSTLPRRLRKKPVNKEGFLYQQKWLKPHLAWMTKEPASMSDSELRSCFILMAMDDWLESQNLKVKEVFAYTETASSGTFGLQDLQMIVRFMDFEDPPSAADVDALAQLLVVRPGLVTVDFGSLEMARVAARFHKESRSRARSCFLKDRAKMSKSESSAYLFFTELSANLDTAGLDAEAFYRMLDVDHTGLVPVAVLVRQARSLHPVEPGKWTAAMAVENPFAFIGKLSEDEVTREEFQDLLEEIREARRLREGNFEEKHPLFISSGTVQPPNSGELPFRLDAFVKVILKVGLMHLMYYGSTPQAQLSSYHKLLWLYVYMHWYLESARHKAEELLKGRRLRPNSREGSGRRYPRHLPAMRRLLLRHPQLFMDVEEVGLPDWATPERTADAVLQRAFREIRGQDGASVEDEMWKVEGIDEEEDGLELGSIEEDPSLAVQGATVLEKTLLATACCVSLAEEGSE